MSSAKSLDFFIRINDHYPQLIGTFALGVTSSNIKIWNITDGKNLEISLANSGCYPIGNTGRWGWSTADLPITQKYSIHYFYTMTSDLGSIFDGQFMMDAKWMYPDNNNNFIL